MKFGVNVGMFFAKSFSYNKSPQIVVRLYAANTTLSKFGVSDGMLFVIPFAMTNSLKL